MFAVTAVSDHQTEKEEQTAVGGRGYKVHIDLCGALKQLGQREITSVLAEGGGGLLGALFDARLVDKACFFYAPKIIGGATAPTAVEGQGIGPLKDAIALRNVEWRHLGDDLVVTGYC